MDAAYLTAVNATSDPHRKIEVEPASIRGSVIAGTRARLTVLEPTLPVPCAGPRRHLARRNARGATSASSRSGTSRCITSLLISSRVHSMRGSSIVLAGREHHDLRVALPQPQSGQRLPVVLPSGKPSLRLEGTCARAIRRSGARRSRAAAVGRSRVRPGASAASPGRHRASCA